MSCSSDVGVPDVGIISRIFRFGGLPRGFTFVGGFGWGNPAIVLEVRGVVVLAVGGIYASFLAVFHQIGSNEVLREKKKVIKEVKYEEKEIGDTKQSEHTTGGFC